MSERYAGKRHSQYIARRIPPASDVTNGKRWTDEEMGRHYQNGVSIFDIVSRVVDDKEQS